MSTAQRSLRSQFFWTFAGNAAQGASQWAILSLLAKLGSAELLGQYALAIAVATPPAMLAHLNLRAVAATDVKGAHPFADYLRVRVFASLAGLVFIAVVSGLGQYTRDTAWAVILVGVALTADQFSDLLYGWMQRKDRLDLAARSMILRSLLALAFTAAALVVFRSVVAAAAALAFARLFSLLAYDVPRSAPPLGSTRDPKPVLMAALPLGIALMLSSLTTNLPRYAIERHLGTRELGAFAAAASFVTIGSTVVNALGQTATTRLARYFETNRRAEFRWLALRLVGLAAGLGLVGAGIAAAAGDFFLRLIYRPEYAAYQDVLLALLLAGAVTYAGAALGFVLTSTRTFAAQIPLLALSAGTCAAVSFALMPSMGLQAAAVALASAAAVQIAGQLVLLSRIR